MKVKARITTSVSFQLRKESSDWTSTKTLMSTYTSLTPISKNSLHIFLMSKANGGPLTCVVPGPTH